MWGKRKIDVLNSLIEDRFPEVVCSTSGDFVGEQELERLARSFNLVIISADNPLGLGRSFENLWPNKNYRMRLYASLFDRK
jgi:ribosome-interacting GTPase 1